MKKILFIAILILALAIPAWAADWKDTGCGAFIDMESVKRLPDGGWQAWTKWQRKGERGYFLDKTTYYPGRDKVFDEYLVMYDKNGRYERYVLMNEWEQVVPDSKLECILENFEAVEKRIREKGTETQQ